MIYHDLLQIKRMIDNDLFRNSGFLRFQTDFWQAGIDPSGSESSCIVWFISFAFFLANRSTFHKKYVEHEFVFASFNLRFIKCISRSTAGPFMTKCQMFGKANGLNEWDHFKLVGLP